MKNQSCVACDATAGFFSNVTGGSACKRCPTNSTAYANATGCGELSQGPWQVLCSGRRRAPLHAAGLVFHVRAPNSSDSHPFPPAACLPVALLCHLPTSLGAAMPVCPDGFGGSANGTCSPCPPGTAGLKLAKTQPCVACNATAGFYSNTANTTQCKQCPAGFAAFVNATGCGASSLDDGWARSIPRGLSTV
jgi:hypothetical protein